MNNKDYLAHYGIKGQKWGLRRYQNSDGTYTSEGKARRNKGNTSVSKKKNTKYGNFLTDHMRAHQQAVDDAQRFQQQLIIQQNQLELQQMMNQQAVNQMNQQMMMPMFFGKNGLKNKSYYGKGKGEGDPYAWVKNSKFSNEADLDAAIKTANANKSLKNLMVAKEAAESAVDRSLNSLDNIHRSKSIKKLKSKEDISKLSNKDLYDLINRMDMEERYYNQKYRYQNLGKKRTSDALKAIGGLTTAGLGAALVASTIRNNNLQGKVLKEQLKKSIR